MLVRFFTVFLFFVPLLQGQAFTRVDDAANPIVTTQTGQNYAGAAWIDYNNDGLLDLFATPSFLFKNLGNGEFESIETIIGNSQTSSQSNGTSWADFDNDGDLDCFLSGRPSTLYMNMGDDTFAEFNYGDLGLTDDFNDYIDNRGWTGSFGDYDNDSWIDLVIVHPQGFLGNPALPSRLMKNNADFTFSSIAGLEFTTKLAPYTVGTWSDYDLDGDIDLFIGSGPAGSPGPDYNYDNLLIDNGIAEFSRIETEPISELQDGQVWNWIDFDNDGDLDACLTNYGGAPNRFYRNDNKSYTKLSNPLTGSGSMLANAWADIDNDGDLDVVFTGDSGNEFYVNNGDGTFISVNNEIASLTSVGATWGDYDNDGDLDLFLSSPNVLFQNTTDNDNGWINISLRGTVSNNAAIGAKVRLKATINDQPVWQFREISAQNSFNSHNSLRAHFGLGDATVIDSVQILWPSGQVIELVEINTNQFLKITEEIPDDFFRANMQADKRRIFAKKADIQFTDLTLTAENNPTTSWQWDFDNDGSIDATEQDPVWTYDSTASYSVRFVVSDGVNTKEKLFENYITLQRTPGVPIINSITPNLTDTTILKRDTILFAVEAIDTSDYDISYAWFLGGVIKSNDSTYSYRASAFGVPRTDTVTVQISNSFNTVERIWAISVVNEITAISDEVSGFPKKFALRANFPNPFNPTTTIRFDLPENAFVKLQVYNLMGQKVITLVNDFQLAGFKEMSWNGKDDFGNRVASGFYFYNIEIKTNTGITFKDNRKMLMIK